MKTLKKKQTIVGIVISLCSFIIIPVMSMLYQHTLGETIRNSVFALFFSLGLIYFWVYSIKTDKLDYDNCEHPYRFLMCFLFSLLLCILFPLINSSGWIYLSIAVALTLFSNAYLGMYVTPCMIMFSVLLKGDNDIMAFFVYFLAAFLSILLFQDIDQNFDVLHSMMVCIFCLFVFETAGFVLLKNKELSFEQFIIPVVNAVVNILVIFGILKYFNEFVANRYRNKYLELNDQEYSALVELKAKSQEDYFRSIHTAYLVERIAFATGCNVDVAKNLAYYHRFKKAFSMSDAECENFIEKHQFPPDCAQAVLRFWDKNNKLSSKEEGIVYISDKMISLLLEIFAKDKKIKINYDEMYDALLKKDYVVEILSESDLSNKDMKIMREIILKENLYYDFLR